MGKAGIWFLVEHEESEPEDISFELATLGRTLAGKLGVKLCAVAFGQGDEGLTRALQGYGVDRFCNIDDSPLNGYSNEAHAQSLASIVAEDPPCVFLFGATLFGSDIAPRLAARRNWDLVSNCKALRVQDDKSLSLTSSIWEGRLDATLVSAGPGPLVVTLVPEAIEKRPVRVPGEKVEVELVRPQFDVERTPRIIGLEKDSAEALSLAEAQVVVAGGSGVGKDNVRLLEHLARLLNGAVAGSRGAVDQGWLSPDRQIGQTGKTVAPRLYVACGISGQLYHTLGMKESRYVVAINKNRNAPIFELADLGLVGDFNEIITAILNRLEEAKKSVGEEPAGTPCSANGITT